MAITAAIAITITHETVRVITRELDGPGVTMVIAVDASTVVAVFVGVITVVAVSVGVITVVAVSVGVIFVVVVSITGPVFG